MNHDHADVADILAAAIAHGGRVFTSPPEVVSFVFTKDAANDGLSHWRQGPITIGGERTIPFDLFGTSIPVGGALGTVRMSTIDTMPVEPLDDLARRIEKADGSVPIDVRVTCTGVV